MYCCMRVPICHRHVALLILVCISSLYNGFECVRNIDIVNQNNVENYNRNENSINISGLGDLNITRRDTDDNDNDDDDYNLDKNGSQINCVDMYHENSFSDSQCSTPPQQQQQQNNNETIYFEPKPLYFNTQYDIYLTNYPEDCIATLRNDDFKYLIYKRKVIPQSFKLHSFEDEDPFAYSIVILGGASNNTKVETGKPEGYNMRIQYWGQDEDESENKWITIDRDYFGWSSDDDKTESIVKFVKLIDYSYFPIHVDSVSGEVDRISDNVIREGDLFVIAFIGDDNNNTPIKYIRCPETGTNDQCYPTEWIDSASNFVMFSSPNQGITCVSSQVQQ